MTGNNDELPNPVESLPTAVRAKFDELPPFIQDTVLRGARLQQTLNDKVWNLLEKAASSGSWQAAEPVVVALAPQLPPQSILEALLFFHAMADQNSKAELIRSLLDLFAAAAEERQEEEPPENAETGSDPVG